MMWQTSTEVHIDHHSNQNKMMTPMALSHQRQREAFIVVDIFSLRPKYNVH